MPAEKLRLITSLLGHTHLANSICNNSRGDLGFMTHLLHAFVKGEIGLGDPTPEVGFYTGNRQEQGVHRETLFLMLFAFLLTVFVHQRTGCLTQSKG